MVGIPKAIERSGIEFQAGQTMRWIEPDCFCGQG
jgi:hypothetical protein